MELTPTQRDKLDPKLSGVLLASYPQEVMKVIFILKVEDPDISNQPHISKFNNYVEWRKALIEWRKKDLDNQVGSTIQSICDLGLEVQGGGLTRLIIASGSVENILKASTLDKVQRVMYNYPVVPS